MRRLGVTSLPVFALCIAIASLVPTALVAQEPERVDYLTLAQGAVPLSVGGNGLGADLSQALMTIDGNAGGFPMLNRAGDDSSVELTFQLPAPTTFDRLSVPNVLETPSPAQTFFRSVEVLGSSEGPETGYRLLASGALTTHSGPGQVTDLAMEPPTAVRWVRLRLTGGIEMLGDRMFLEFSEIIGNGVQDAPALADSFTGTWRGRGVALTLSQRSALVTGCYDDGSSLTGTVTGNLLRAIGVGAGDGVESQFVIAVTDDGSIRGVRSTNGAPFRLYTGAASDRAVECATPPEPILGCGSVIHGIGFAFDSAELMPVSEPVLALLFDGLRDDPSAEVLIEGHTSSEGAESYNLDLSERRARAVVDDLARRGIPPSRLRSAGRGESTPIASNDDETGRSLNRRVEVVCR